MSAKLAKNLRPKLSKPKRLMILRKSKALRMWLLRNPWVRPMCVFNFAAIKIQQNLRGFIHRMKLSRRQSGSAVSKKGSKRKAGNKQLDKYLKFMDNCRKQTVSKPAWLEEGYSSWCAVRIQSSWRMRRVYKKRIFAKRLVNQVASIIIQTAWRNHLYRARVMGLNDLRQPVILDVYVAAQMIQMCWRHHCNKRIYRYFRDLVTKQLKGAPYDLLRSIIPNESHLLDRASGVHVRFRLGGRVFPPKVYFKIYTHRPLCDVNAFAPRNYAGERPPDPAQVLNRSSTITQKPSKPQVLRVGAKYFGAVITTTSANGTADWYKRDESNDWRPIASQMFENIATPPWFREFPHGNGPRPFHFSKLRREEDLRKARKKRRRQWMVKAYLFATTAAATSMATAQAKHQTTAQGRRLPGAKEQDAEWEDSVMPGYGNTPSSFRYADTKQETASNIIASYYNQTERPRQQAASYAADGKANSRVSAATAANDLRSAAADFKRSFTDGDADSKTASSGSLFSRRPNLGGLLEHKAQSSSGAGGKGGISVAMGRRQESPSARRSKLGETEYTVDLVDWSLALNFDDYTMGWGQVGTSLPSDAKDCRDR